MTTLLKNSFTEERVSSAQEPVFAVEGIANPGRFITTSLFSYTEDVLEALEEGIMEPYHASRPMED